MKKHILFLTLVIVMLFAASSLVIAAPPSTGKHFNLNIIGIAQCTKNSETDPDCFKGNAGDIQTSGHTVFVPLRTAQTEDICASDDNIMPPEMYDIAWLQKGVRILVSDAGGDDIQVVDRDATDGQARLNLPDGCYNIYARALGKPGGCMDVDTVICYDWVVDQYVQVDCTLSNDKYVVVGHLEAALEKGDVTSVLKWAKKEDEAEIKDLFSKTRIVRAKGKESRELADRYFLETLVRLHRAGEGEPYTGLKPAGAVEPAVAEADKALESSSVENLVKLITDATAKGIRERLNAAKEAKKHVDYSVEAGRGFVAAYVQFTHYVERLHLDASAPAEHHHASPEAAMEHHQKH